MTTKRALGSWRNRPNFGPTLVLANAALPLSQKYTSSLYWALTILMKVRVWG